MTEVRIPITKPVFGAEERDAIVRPLDNGWVVQGPYVREFERKFAEFAGVPFAAATTSCTSALHLALAALDLRQGDEVIVPAFTWISTANVVEFFGARPIFCDIDLRTFNIDVDRIESLIGQRTVGVIPVHLFGLCADIDRIQEVARRRKLWVVEDAACAFGARIRGRHAGSFGEMGCFSFHPRKAITTGEGGMVTTAREDLHRRVSSLRDHGASRSDLARHTASGAFLLPEFELLGFNYRMTDIQGALGSVQMDRGDAILTARRNLARMYDERLASVEWLDLPVVPAGYEHGYQAYVCLFRPEPPTLAIAERLHLRRNALMARLEAKGIASRQGTHAPPLTGYYSRKYGLRPNDYPNAALAEKLSLALPLYPQMEEREIDEVCEALTATTRVGGG